MGYRLCRYRHEHCGWPVLLLAESHDRGDDHVLHFRAGPKLRRSFCQWLAPSTQRRFLLVWTVAQGQISSFLFSRSILALINATCTAIFLEILPVPYWLPLALFCGVVSQFIPTVGTYIGGALPVLFAWGNRGWTYAVAVLVFIIVYQQIEN